MFEPHIFLLIYMTGKDANHCFRHPLKVKFMAIKTTTMTKAHKYALPKLNHYPLKRKLNLGQNFNVPHFGWIIIHF